MLSSCAFYTPATVSQVKKRVLVRPKHNRVTQVSAQVQLTCLAVEISDRSQAPQAAGSLALHYLPAFTYAPIRFVHSRSRLVSRSTNVSTRVNDLQDGKQVSEARSARPIH